MPRAPSPDYRKPCTLCHKPRDVLVRCQIDERGVWHFICPGSCWSRVSGGVVDGDGSEEHRCYRYGGMWKNKHEAVSAKKPKKVGNRSGPAQKSTGVAQAAQAQMEIMREIERNPEDVGGACEDMQDELQEWSGADRRYEKDETIAWKRRVWTCRKEYTSNDKRTPDAARSLWKLRGA